MSQHAFRLRPLLVTLLLLALIPAACVEMPGEPTGGEPGDDDGARRRWAAAAGPTGRARRRGVQRQRGPRGRAAAGPARRVYSITAQGLEMLHAWKPRIEHVRRRLDRFLEEYARYVSE